MLARYSRPIAAALPVLLALTALLAPAPAPAAPATVPFEDVYLQLDPGSGTHQPVLVITGTLADDAQLPATVRFAVPQGLQMRWAGEILGGALEDDPTVEPVFEHTESGFDLAVLTLSKSRVAQIELDAAPLLNRSDTSQSIMLPWGTPDDIGALTLSTLVPAGAEIETMTPGAVTEPGPNGALIVSLETSAVAGSPVALNVTHTATALPASQNSAPSGSTAPLVIIFGGLAVAFALAVAAISRRTRERREAQAAEDTTQDEELEPTRDPESRAQDADGSDDEPVGEVAPTRAAASGRRLTPGLIIMLVVAAVLGGAVLAMTSGESPGTTKTTSEYAYKVIADVKADATYSAPIALSESDPAHEATHVFDAVAAVQGVRSVRLVFAGPSIEVQYSSELAAEQDIAAALAASGY